MKIFVEKLDNGYRLNITTVEEHPDGEAPGAVRVEEVKRRLVYEDKRALMAKLEETL